MTDPDEDLAPDPKRSRLFWILVLILMAAIIFGAGFYVVYRVSIP